MVLRLRAEDVIQVVSKRTLHLVGIGPRWRMLGWRHFLLFPFRHGLSRNLLVWSCKVLHDILLRQHAHLRQPCPLLSKPHDGCDNGDNGHEDSNDHKQHNGHDNSHEQALAALRDTAHIENRQIAAMWATCATVRTCTTTII